MDAYYVVRLTSTQPSEKWDGQHSGQHWRGGSGHTVQTDTPEP